MWLHYLVKHNMWQSVHNHSNGSITNWQLWTNTSQQMFKVFAFGFVTRIRMTISPLINAWSVMRCWISNHAQIVSSGTLAECLYVWVWCVPMHLRNASFLGDLTGSFVCPWCTFLTEYQIIDCINVLSSTWCARCPMSGCQSVVPVSRSF